MTTTLRLLGALPALVTPLDERREPHLDDLTRLVRRALDDGASGVLVGGSTGEGALLTPAQRETLTRGAREALDGAATDADTPPLLLSGAVGLTPDELVADVERLAAAGADAVLVLPPPVYHLRAEELAALHLDVAERTSAPQLVYHFPMLTGSSLTPETLQELVTHPRIVGMKDSSPDAERRAAFAAVSAGRDDFALFTGHAPTLRDALAAGADGSITAIANVRQRKVVALHAAVAAGDGGEAERSQTALTRTSTGITEAGAAVPAVLKAALQLDGVVTERWCRPPLQSMPTARLDAVRSALLR